MNKVLLSEDRLQLILERHKDQIGSKSNWGNIITGITFFLSTVAASYEDMPFVNGKILKMVILLGSGFFTIWGIIMEIYNQKNKFNNEKLYEEMKEANEIEHPFSIIAIKDTFEQYPNKYLLYFDNRWKCWFFLNFKTNSNDDQNESNIRKGISSKLKIDTDEIALEYKGEEIHRKYSVSNQEDRYYHHKLYNCEIKNFNDNLKNEKFTIDDVKYTWMTIDEMEKNPSIIKHNMDVVEFVKHNN